MTENSQATGRKRTADESEKEIGTKKIKQEVLDEVPVGISNLTDEKPKSNTSSVENQENAVLRKEMQKWLRQYPEWCAENVEASMKDLANLSDAAGEAKVGWCYEVLCLRQVQSAITRTADFITSTADGKAKKDLCSQLRQILQPYDRIETRYFPNIKQIVQTIQQDTTVKGLFTFKTDRNLPSVLKKELKQIAEEGDNTTAKVRSVQERLEATMKVRIKNTKNVYQYLVCLCVVKLFGFNINTFTFNHHLCRSDLTNMAKVMEGHLKILDAQDDVGSKQACVLKLILCSVQENGTVYKFVIDKMPEGLCSSLDDIFKNVRDTESSLDLKKLHTRIDELMKGKQAKLYERSLLYSIKSQLHFLQKGFTQPDGATSAGDSLNPVVESLMQMLGMRKYYPQKLTYDDVIKLTADVYGDIDVRPTTFPELPWYFLRRVIGLDSEVRENCHLLRENDDSDTEDTICDIHSLDLIYIVFLCANDFLRQELVDKMVKCQYAVPFVLPSPTESSPSSKSLVLHWALRSVAKSFSIGNKVENKTLIDMKAPVVVCIGKETTWKSKLLNKMLSPQQEAFWHQGLKGGDCEQKISHGMIELAWHLPGQHGADSFRYPVSFLNVRHNVCLDNIVYNNLPKSSTILCVFTEYINQELYHFLETKECLDKIVLVILHKEEDEKAMRKESKELQTRFNLGRHQVIRKTARDASFNAAFDHLKISIDLLISDCNQFSLSSFVRQLKTGNIVRVDDSLCYYGQAAAQNVLGDIDRNNRQKSGSAKSEILPCQADIKLRQEVSALEKELCRQNKLDQEKTVQKYAFDVKERKWQLQLGQLRKPLSETFKYFLRCISTLRPSDRKYFIQCLKLGLNERSVEVLQPLYEEYENCRRNDKSKEKDMKLKSLSDKLTHGSLGIEHFFREMAVIYDNMMALREKSGHFSDLDEILDLMSISTAAVLADGTAIEIMDGDAVTVPVDWLNAVLLNAQDNVKSTLFKVSVLGAQSCGKSTLLNTIFGLNFPVSSGRCTRGAYMQLVAVDEALEETLHCNYIAVIDSEGLMSRSKDEPNFDNELSTFIIGLSDLTLVIIKGEGNEMHDVLPLAIHVFLKMNIVGEHQACHFVHQNMGAVDAMSKVATEIDAFVRDLNAKTLAAARDVDQSDKYKTFTDVLSYDSTKDNTYVPGLWTGSPPMGKASSHYSRTMLTLKAAIVSSITGLHNSKRKSFCTFPELTKRVEELWNAIKYENFVLSFKNVLAMEAHKQLSKIFDDEQWTLKRYVQKMLQEEQHIIENEIVGGESEQTADQLIDASRQKVEVSIQEKIENIKGNILHYFQCAACKDCNAEVTNRHLIANNEKEFVDDINVLKKSLLRDTDAAMEKIVIKLRTDERINDLSATMDDVLKKKVQEATRAGEVGKHPTQNIEETFSTLWNEATSHIQRFGRSSLWDANIEGAIQGTVRVLLGTGDHLYMQKLTSSNVREHRSKSSSFKVDRQRHMKIKTIFSVSVFGFSDQDVNRLQKETQSIVNQTLKYYDSANLEGKLFNPRDAEDLLQDVIRRIDAIDDERFKVTQAYRVDLLSYIQTLAVAGFTKMHQTFCNHNSPEALLEKKRRSYYDIFIIKMGQADAASEFSKNVMADITQDNVLEQLSCAELLHELRVNCGDMFRDIKSIQASIMVDLFRENNFEGYIEYISNYEACIKKKLRDRKCQIFDWQQQIENSCFNKTGPSHQCAASSCREHHEQFMQQRHLHKNFVLQNGKPENFPQQNSSIFGT